MYIIICNFLYIICIISFFPAALNTINKKSKRNELKMYASVESCLFVVSVGLIRVVMKWSMRIGATQSTCQEKRLSSSYWPIFFLAIGHPRSFLILLKKKKKEGAAQACFLDKIASPLSPMTIGLSREVRGITKMTK